MANSTHLPSSGPCLVVPGCDQRSQTDWTCSPLHVWWISEMSWSVSRVHSSIREYVCVCVSVCMCGCVCVSVGEWVSGCVGWVCACVCVWIVGWVVHDPAKACVCKCIDGWVMCVFAGEFGFMSCAFVSCSTQIKGRFVSIISQNYLSDSFGHNYQAII